MKTVITTIALTLGALFAAEAHALSNDRRQLEPIIVTKLSTSAIDDHQGVPVGLTFTAFFGGCGRADDFDVRVTTVAGTQHVRVTRLKQDPCELYAPAGKSFTLRTDKIDLSRPVVVDNPLFVSRDVNR